MQWVEKDQKDPRLKGSGRTHPWSDWPIFQSQETCPHHHHHHLHRQPHPTQVSCREPTGHDPMWPSVNSLVKATQSVQRCLKTSRFIWTSSTLNGNPGTRPVITDLRKRKSFDQRESGEQGLTPFACSFSLPAGFWENVEHASCKTM